MQFDDRAMFAQFQQNQNRPAPAVMMLDASLQYHGSPPLRSDSSSHGKLHVESQPPMDSERMLPAPDINRDSIEDSYVQFIFHCNPSIPLSVDSAELRRGLQSMPKTDGKSFEIFDLYKLIQRLESKEIESWAQLVIELGVEPPDITKSQSSQKVQQFAVRIKRWLHAFHIDAFFHYCFGKPSVYCTEIPGENEAIAETIRDGVPPEEDLALRALLPEWRPKRGRRKAESHDNDIGTPAKRLARASSLTADPMTGQEAFSAHPQSAYPWSQTTNQNAWVAASQAILPRSNPQVATQQPNPSFDGQHNFWVDVPEDGSSTAYPQSAVTPRHGQSMLLPKDVPQSAHPLNTSKSRKRHGPAVSAAWPSTPTGKIRGRPPSNRTSQDGPFSTFPANPQIKPIPPKSPGLGVGGLENHPPVPPTPVGSANSFVPVSANQVLAKKPSKLQLQVPQHSGGPVRLATPPPKLLVNGEDGGQIQAQQKSSRHERRTSADFFNHIDDDESEIGDNSDDDEEGIDWKKRAFWLRRKLKEKEAELKGVKRRVLDAVM